jgi:NADPH-dependent 2,4-dienoyl-CoA reductase/sulfur reductase-like enzyme
VDVDMTVIGAGPVGLYAAYYAGFRGMRTAIVDSLPGPGGQISALYPEKLIYDIAGFPQVRGRDLVSGLVDQAEKFGPEWLLGHSADGLEHLDGGRLRITTRQGAAVSTGALVIAGGIGTFSPRPLPAGAALLGRGLDYFVTAPDEYAGQDVLVVGGGDSAVDWALTLEPIAKSVTLVHRQPQFTAHAGSASEETTVGVSVVLSGSDRARARTAAGRARLGGVVRWLWPHELGEERREQAEQGLEERRRLGVERVLGAELGEIDWRRGDPGRREDVEHGLRDDPVRAGRGMDGVQAEQASLQPAGPVRPEEPGVKVREFGR